MDKNSYKMFLAYLINFRRNYNYYASNYSGRNVTLYLNHFIDDQMKAAQVIYGDQGAKMVKEVAVKLSNNGRRSRFKDQFTQSC